VTVLTQGEAESPAPAVRVETVRSRRPHRLLALLRRLRMDKLLEMILWPDESIFWVIPAILAGRRAIRRERPSAIVVFTMPYSGALAGIALRRLSGLPLVLNFDDSPTCTDMHPDFPTRLHHRLARALEDFCIRHADAVVYVSAGNLERVRARQPEAIRERLHLVRYGADPPQVPDVPPSRDFELVYVGAMSGWWSLVDAEPDPNPMARIYGAWTRLGRFELTKLDQRTSSPAVVGRAIVGAVASHAGWAGRVKLTVYGNPYPPALVERATASAGVERVVEVNGPVPHEEVTAIVAGADLLFMTLPKRLDDSPGGRISAKTYEYLATDRPILAAVPRGENWDYLTGKDGVWLVAPDDEAGMRAAIVELASAKFAGSPMTFPREDLREELSYDTRAKEFAAVIGAALDARR
jgi:glycosyltransferase involved in cell wall biosynthesis